MSDGKGGWLTMQLIRYYLAAYSGYAFLLSGLAAISGVAMWSQAGPEFAALAAYGVVSAFLMLVSWDRLRRKTLDATRWTRIALAIALPGSVVTGTFGVVSLALAVMGLSSLHVSPLAWPLLAFAVFILSLSLLNVAALLVVLFLDLDKLLWARHADEVVGAGDVRFVEEETAFDFSEADPAVAAQEMRASRSDE